MGDSASCLVKGAGGGPVRASPRLRSRTSVILCLRLTLFVSCDVLGRASFQLAAVLSSIVTKTYHTVFY